MVAVIVFAPLTNRGPVLLDALEAKTGHGPSEVAEDGSRTYFVDTDTAAFDVVLDGLDPDWREHLTRTL